MKTMKPYVWDYLGDVTQQQAIPVYGSIDDIVKFMDGELQFAGEFIFPKEDVFMFLDEDQPTLLSSLMPHDFHSSTSVARVIGVTKPFIGWMCFHEFGKVFRECKKDNHDA